MLYYLVFLLIFIKAYFLRKEIYMKAIGIIVLIGVILVVAYRYGAPMIKKFKDVFKK